MNNASLQSQVCEQPERLKKVVRLEMENWILNYQSKLMLIAYGFLKDYYLAEDCVQEALIKAGLNYENVIQKNNIYPWIHRILVNECKSTLRTKWIKNVSKLDYFHDEGSADEYPSLMQSDLRTLILQLPFTIRMPLLLYYFEDLQISEVAQALKIKEATCRVRLHRGRNLLREYLNRERAVEESAGLLRRPSDLSEEKKNLGCRLRDLVKFWRDSEGSG